MIFLLSFVSSRESLSHFPADSLLACLSVRQLTSVAEANLISFTCPSTSLLLCSFRRFFLLSFCCSSSLLTLLIVVFVLSFVFLCCCLFFTFKVGLAFIKLNSISPLWLLRCSEIFFLLYCWKKCVE